MTNPSVKFMAKKEVSRELSSPSSDVSDYGIAWLFDPDNYDYLPLDEQLKLYKQRDLRKVKVFKTAAKIWGFNRSRKRVIVAPPMELQGSQKEESSWDGLERKTMNSVVKPQKFTEKPPTEEEEKFKENERQLSEYKNWVEERKKMRESLKNMGLNEKWLAHKPDKTPLEERLLARFIKARTIKPPTPPPAEPEPRPSRMEFPVVNLPSPEAIKIIDSFLKKKKMRLLDLFRLADKDRSGSVTKEEFKGAVKKVGIPISDVLLEDLLLALDKDMDDELDYKELSKGMELWKHEKMETRRRGESSASAGRTVGETVGTERDSRHGRIETRSGSAQLLPPDSDLREEQKILSSEEAMLDLRKRNREALTRQLGKRIMTPKKKKKPKVISTGNRAIDDHLQASTLTGENAALVNKFRQLKVKEYQQIIALCQQAGIELNTHLFERVLLSPPDKSHSELKKHLRFPQDELLSSHFADPPRRPSTPIEEKLKDKVHRSSTGTLMIDTRHVYPSGNAVKKTGQKMALSTGKAVVSRKVDCWMTFEEYEKLTSNFAIRYQKLHGQVENNAFWPGHLLDKLYLCMPRPHPSGGASSLNAVFTSTRDRVPSNSGRDTQSHRLWPTNQAGYVQYGIYDPFYNKPNMI